MVEERWDFEGQREAVGLVLQVAELGLEVVEVLVRRAEVVEEVLVRWAEVVEAEQERWVAGSERLVG